MVHLYLHIYSASQQHFLQCTLLLTNFLVLASKITYFLAHLVQPQRFPHFNRLCCSFCFLIPYAEELQSECFISLLALTPLGTSFSWMAFQNVQPWQMHRLGLMFQNVYIEIIDNFILEFVFYKWRLMNKMEYEPSTWRSLHSTLSLPLQLYNMSPFPSVLLPPPRNHCHLLCPGRPWV